VTRRAVLVVEDGTEYVDAFRRLAPESADVEWLHAADAAAARAVLAGRRVDAIFLDVVFDRTPPGRLVGDPARGVEHLARNQGFHVLAEIAPLVAAGTPVLLAHDFSNQGARLQALREKVPALEGVAEGETATRMLERLTASAP
jgi:CheY-like chemotaxis protein